MFKVASLITTPKAEKEPKRPSLGEQINKPWDSHIIEYNWAIKGNQILRLYIYTRVKITWLNIKCITLNEGRQNQMVVWINLYDILKKVKL